MRLPAEESLKRDLKLVVFESVDEWVDAAVEEDTDDGEVVEVAVEVDFEAEVVHGEVDLVGRPAGDEAHAHHREDFDDIVARLRRSLVTRGCTGGGRTGSDAVLAAEHRRDAAVAEGDERQRDEVLDDDGDDTDRRLGRLVRPHGEDRAPAVDDSRGGDHVGGVVRRSDAPHARHHDVGPPAGEPMTVAERVDDGHVPLDGDRHEVVGGREEHSPRR